MTRGRLAVLGSLVVVLVAVAAVFVLVNQTRDGRRTTKQLEADIAALRTERDRLRPHVVGALNLDPRFSGMPDRQLRVGIPTTLARELVTTLIAAIPEHVTLQLSGLRVRRQGEIKRVVTVGEYDLNVRITRVSARLATGDPDLRFGGNRLSLALPVRVASGDGSATIDFKWDGRNLGNAVCGDMQFKEVVTGTVTPATYKLSGSLHLSSTDEAILITPRFPTLRIAVHVSPTRASWDLVQTLLDSKKGLCGFVLDRVDIRGALEELLAKGFAVRLPTERLRPFTLPIGIASTLSIRDTPVHFGGTAGSLTISDEMIWVGANVTVAAPTLELPAVKTVPTPRSSPRGGS